MSGAKYVRAWLSPRALDVVAAILVVMSAGLLVLPGSSREITAVTVRVPSSSRNAARPQFDGADSTTPDSVARAIVRTNVFSASRREPTVHFAAPGLETSPPVFLMPEPGPDMAATADMGPRLFGIISTDGTLRALVQLRASDEAPRLMSAGEAQGNVRVQRVEKDRVVISTSTGTRTLRLSRAVPDSIRNAP